MNYPKIVVQILVYNESEDIISKLMKSLGEVDYPKEFWSIVILNNHCENRDLYTFIKTNWLTAPNSRLPKIILEKSATNLVYSGGHQFAWENYSSKEKPDFVYILNGDALVDTNFLKALAIFIDQNPDVPLIQSRIMTEQNPELINSIGNAMHFLGFGFSKGYKEKFDLQKTDFNYIPTFFASGAGLAIKTDIIDKIGGLFDPVYLIYHEDLDISWRVRIAGYKFEVAMDSVIYHKYEFAKSIRQFYLMERNRHITNFGNYQLLTLILIAPAYLIMELGTFAFAIKSGWAKEKLKSWAHLFHISTWKWIFARRKFIKSIRKVNDLEILKLTTGSVLNQEIENFLLNKIVNPMMEVYLKVVKFILRAML